ncbi:hypothetical protein OF855_24485 [Mycolicibacterium fortuitum]|uniref:hypothetical protein n=1 Tax=Mycolicibacterium fortuitum TaxID=1766 RepID=UPI0022BA1218|nr:hypothetical protein [Mycolicibacterium fortuitum]WAY18398.1 hypothetical protein OF855_24485 [Mycolicibacterium fortuitum]
MPSYKILEPCVYAVNGGKSTVHHTEPGAIVELDTAAARELGDKVERIAETVRKAREDTEGDDK